MIDRAAPAIHHAAGAATAPAFGPHRIRRRAARVAPAGGTPEILRAGPPTAPAHAAPAVLHQVSLFSQDGALCSDVTAALLARVEARMLTLAHGKPVHGARADCRAAALRHLPTLRALQAQVRADARQGRAPSLDTTVALHAFLAEAHGGVKHADAVLSELLPALRTQVGAAWAALVRPAILARLRSRYQAYEQPNCATTTSVRGALQPGLDAPLPGAGAGVLLGGQAGVSLATGEDGGILSSASVMARIGAWLRAGLAIVQARISVAFSLNRTKAVEFDNLDHYLGSSHTTPHRALSGTPLGLPWSGPYDETVRIPLPPGLKLGWFGLRHASASLHDLDSLQERAHNERDIFARIMGAVQVKRLDGAGTPCCVNAERRAPHTPLPGRLAIDTYAVEAAASAHAGLSAFAGIGAQATGTHLHTRIRYAARVPFWDAVRTDRGSGAAVRARALADLYPLVEPALARIAGRRDFSLYRVQDTQQLTDLLAQVESEFDLYCHAQRQAHAGKPQAAQIARRIEAAWNAKGKPSKYAYLQRVAMAHALIGLRLKSMAAQDALRATAREQADRAADAAAAPAPRIKAAPADPECLARFARKLARPPMPHDQDTLTRYGGFDNATSITRLQSRIALKANAGFETPHFNGSASIEAALGLESRRDPNMLREGEYRTLTFDAAVGGYGGTQWQDFMLGMSARSAELQLDLQQLDGAARQAFDLLDHLQPGLRARGSIQLVLQFFRPGDALGGGPFRFQFARALKTLEAGLSTYTRPIAECWGDDTLTYVLMRHHRMYSGDTTAQAWPRFAGQGRAALERMFAGLAKEDSGIRGEAALLWRQVMEGSDGPQREVLARRQADFFLAMRAHAAAPTPRTFATAFAALEDLAQAHMLPWKARCNAGTRRLAHVQLAN